MRSRQIALVALILAVAVVGFVLARMHAERDVQRDSERRAEVAAAQIHGRIAQAASLTESLRRFMLEASGTGVTSDRFARNAFRWLSPADFPAAAWVEPVPDSQRAEYERRTGQPIVTADERHSVVPAGSRSSYLPATLVSGFPPLALPGVDLSGEPDMAAALDRATGLGLVSATGVAGPDTGMNGLFLVASAPNLVGESLIRGYVVVFVPYPTLSAAANTPGLWLAVGGTGRPPAGEQTVSASFTEAGQRFDVILPRGAIHGAATALPWIILACGLVLAALVPALGINAARRARAQNELDRIFNLSPDMIAVANFEKRFTRVNPAAEQILGYTRDELLQRPFLDFVHPDDREWTAAESAAIGQGKATQSFENRYVRKDGSYRVLEWTATPVVEEGVMYAVARDVTERRQAEIELERLAREQAALRRVATLVAGGVGPEEVFAAVVAEAGRLLEVEIAVLIRYDPQDMITVVGMWTSTGATGPTAVGTRMPFGGQNIHTRVFESGRSARIDDYSATSGAFADAARDWQLRASVGVPIRVEGQLWGVMSVGSRPGPLPADTENRLTGFTELVATAIANAEAQAALAASRARIVAAGDAARRRMERDLHDRAQQRLVSLALRVRAMQAMPPEAGELSSQLDEVVAELNGAVDELREIASGLHPAVLAEGGLRPVLKTLARRSAVPVNLDVAVDGRLPEPVELAAYCVVAEALTNTSKHAGASGVDVTVTAGEGVLRVAVRDDGRGGADPTAGSGLVGLTDRTEALGGRLWVNSPPGAGTTVQAMLPLTASGSPGLRAAGPGPARPAEPDGPEKARES
jgi:PAS domain S-box-containing protein